MKAPRTDQGRWAIVLACLAFLALASCSAIPTQDVPHESVASRGDRVGLYAGQRYLDEGDWKPVDEQLTFGIEYSQEKPGSVIGWEVGFLRSSDDDDVMGFDVEVTTSELYGGVRKSFGDGIVRPYLGAGLALINLEVEISGVGVDLRALFGSDLDIAGFDTDADYEQLALMLGFGF